MRDFAEFDGNGDDDIAWDNVLVSVSYPTEWQLAIDCDTEIEMGYVEELMWVRVDEIAHQTKQPILTLEQALVAPDMYSPAQEHLAHDRGFLMGVYYAIEVMLGETVADQMLDRALEGQRREHWKRVDSEKKALVDDSMRPEYV